MHFVTMKPADIRKALEGTEDVITPAVEAEQELYKNTRCPMCMKAGCQKKLQAPEIMETPEGPEVLSSAFGDGVIPDGYAHCIHCGTDFNPRTGMIYRTEASMIHAPQSDLLPR